MTTEPTTEDIVLEGPDGPFSVRVYRPDAALDRGIGLVWVHGGSWVFGDLDFPEAHGVSLALARDGVTVVSVDYHLAPMAEMYIQRIGVPASDGVTFPVASREVAHAFAWASDAAAPGVREWSLGGGSAGANIAAGSALRLRDEGGPQPTSLVLVYVPAHPELPPLSDELQRTLSVVPGGADGANDYDELVLNYAGDADRLASPYAFPGGHDLTRLPPTFVLNSEFDVLRASGERFAAELASAGVNVLQLREDGASHGQLMDVTTEFGERSLRRVLVWLTTPELRGTARGW